VQVLLVLDFLPMLTCHPARYRIAQPRRDIATKTPQSKTLETVGIGCLSRD